MFNLVGSSGESYADSKNLPWLACRQSPSKCQTICFYDHPCVWDCPRVLYTDSQSTLFLENTNLKEFVIQKSRLSIICKIYPEIFSPGLSLALSVCVYIGVLSRSESPLGESCQFGIQSGRFQEEAEHMGCNFRRKSHGSAGKKGRTFLEKTESSWVVVEKLVCLNRNRVQMQQE